jgi:hypothetical protein
MGEQANARRTCCPVRAGKRGFITTGEKETGEFNNAHKKYVEKKIVARRTGDGSELNHAYDECKNKALALRDVLREQDPENSARVDGSIADLEICHGSLLREL